MFQFAVGGKLIAIFPGDRADVLRDFGPELLRDGRLPATTLGHTSIIPREKGDAGISSELRRLILGLPSASFFFLLAPLRATSPA
jgi:hypothetical protein